MMLSGFSMYAPSDSEDDDPIIPDEQQTAEEAPCDCPLAERVREVAKAYLAPVILAEFLARCGL